MYSNRCYNRGRLHKFQARYDEKSFIPSGLKAEGCDFEKLKTHVKTYIHDICIWCGKTVDREKAK